MTVLRSRWVVATMVVVPVIVKFFMTSANTKQASTLSLTTTTTTTTTTGKAITLLDMGTRTLLSVSSAVYGMNSTTATTTATSTSPAAATAAVGAVAMSTLLLSRTEISLRYVFADICGRLPTAQERNQYYNDLKSGELEPFELAALIAPKCTSSMAAATADSELLKASKKANLSDWRHRMPNKTYAWTVDFHSAPAACNIPIYSEIGFVLRAEIDHKPHCDFHGTCKNRLKVFGLGGYMAGFALDPDHNALKKDFFQHYKNDPEFNRIDLFVCSHPAANCELFERFQKPFVLFFTTRLEFGRDDLAIGWRAREVSKWNAGSELKPRMREWIQFIVRHHAAGNLLMAANNRYDVEYVEYFTGIRPLYLPSWCGDSDNSYGGKKEWVGTARSDVITNTTYIQKALIIPYKQYLWAAGPSVDEKHRMYIQMMEERHWYIGNMSKYPPEVVHSNHELHRDHSPERYIPYIALVLIPYQTSIMTFFELYRLNIPMFAPSLELLVEWHQTHKVLSGRIYGWPERHVDLIANATGKSANTSIPNPNDDMNRQSNMYWFQFADWYAFPNIQKFSSWYQLYHLLSTTNFTDVRMKMSAFNRQNKIELKQKWSESLQSLLKTSSTPAAKKAYKME